MTYMMHASFSALTVPHFIIRILSDPSWFSGRGSDQKMLIWVV